MSKTYLMNELVFKKWGPTKMSEVATEIIERAIDTYDDDNNQDVYDIVSTALDEGFIYYYQEWEMLQFYCSPKEANYDKAYEEFENDLIEVVSQLVPASL